MYLMETMQGKRQKLSENNWYLGILAFGGGVFRLSTENDIYIYLLLVGMTFE